ncbi:methyltransferase [Streptomyces uncialis]|uniref:methyltransferase n=2 Tax=Streptomyces TaxID=1883 RepID=UPI00382CE1EB
MSDHTLISPPASDLLLRDAVTGYRRSQVIYAAVKLGIVDALADGPRSAAALARHCGADAAVLPRFLRVLVAEGLLGESDGEGFSLTPHAAPLRSDAPGSLAAWVVTVCEEQFFAWGHVLHTVRTGGSAFEQAFGTGFWQYLRDHDTAASAYDAGMADSIGQARDLVVAGHDFGPARRVADIGGGRGALTAALLDAHPTLHVTLVDLPDVVTRAAGPLGARGWGDRLTLAPADFLDEVPGGHDVHILCRVLADWDDHRARRILTTCRRAMEPGAVLLIAEGLARPADPAGARGLLDLHLLLLIGGRERSADDYRTLLSEAGFTVRGVQDTGRISLIEAVAC